MPTQEEAWEAERRRLIAQIDTLTTERDRFERDALRASLRDPDAALAKVRAEGRAEVADSLADSICIALRGSDGVPGHPGEFISVNEAEEIVREVSADLIERA